MRKFSLVLAAAVMAVGLAVSGTAFARSGFDVYTPEKSEEILLEGDILFVSKGKNSSHIFTVVFKEKVMICKNEYYEVFACTHSYSISA
jgi:hypothetical protein